MAATSQPQASEPSFKLRRQLPLRRRLCESSRAELSEDEVELIDIFLEEAREVVQNGLLAGQSAKSKIRPIWRIKATLRRAFHTLKGSSRMVGLNDFGESAWAYEQLLNNWLAEQRPASDESSRRPVRPCTPSVVGSIICGAFAYGLECQDSANRPTLCACGVSGSHWSRLT